MCEVAANNSIGVHTGVVSKLGVAMDQCAKFFFDRLIDALGRCLKHTSNIKIKSANLWYIRMNTWDEGQKFWW
jgi:hypothetical protein